MKYQHYFLQIVTTFLIGNCKQNLDPFLALVKTLNGRSLISSRLNQVESDVSVKTNGYLVIYKETSYKYRQKYIGSPPGK